MWQDLGVDAFQALIAGGDWRGKVFGHFKGMIITRKWIPCWMRSQTVRTNANITEHKARLPACLDMPRMPLTTGKPIRNMHGKAVNNAAYSFDSVAESIPGQGWNLIYILKFNLHSKHHIWENNYCCISIPCGLEVWITDYSHAKINHVKDVPTLQDW